MNLKQVAKQVVLLLDTYRIQAVYVVGRYLSNRDFLIGMCCGSVTMVLSMIAGVSLGGHRW